MKKILALLLALAMVVSLAACTSSSDTPPAEESGNAEVALDYPTKPITFMVAAKAGGGLDIISRIAAKHLQAAVGQNVNVENNATGSGAVAYTTVATGAKDGYNMILITNSNIMDSYLREDCFYSLESFTPICTVDVSPVVLVVKKGGEFDIPLSEIIEKAKTEDISMGIALTWKAADYARLMLMEETGVTFTRVAYSGSGTEAAQAVASGEIDMAFLYPNEANSYVQAGDLNCVAVSSDSRFSALPDVPTIQELGYNVPNLVLRRCIAIASGTDKAVVDYLSDTFQTILSDPAVVQEYADAAVEVCWADSETTLAQLKTDYETYYNFLSSHDTEAGGVPW